MTVRHDLTVPPELDGCRLDRALATLSPGWSRSRARKLIDDGCVHLNGQPARPAHIVHPGDALVVDEPAVATTDVEPEAIPLSILYEDDDLLVLDKPPGLVIHPAAGNPRGTLVNALLHHCDDLSGIGGVERPGIVHRLDKDTTGTMVVAKSDRAHLALSLAFQRRQIGKTYLAVCYGAPSPTDGVIDAPIGRHPRERQQMAVHREGRPARTLYEVVETLTATSLVACRLVTGRTHQIRVHLAHIGHALVGDPLYTGRQWRNLPDPSLQRLCRDFPRQALHAWRLAFDHPVTGDHVEFEAPVPADIEGLVKALRPAD